jgi:hypothetical protein
LIIIGKVTLSIDFKEDQGLYFTFDIELDRMELRKARATLGI